MVFNFYFYSSFDESCFKMHVLKCIWYILHKVQKSFNFIVQTEIMIILVSSCNHCSIFSYYILIFKQLQRGSDEAWAQKLFDLHLGKSKHFEKSKLSNTSFFVVHFADKVRYNDVNNILLKWCLKIFFYFVMLLSYIYQNYFLT